jgi:hypothetical protein
METADQKNFELATEEYESIVAHCADADSSLELSNRHIAHAAILTKHIVRRTENTLDIITGSMPELFFSKIKKQLETTLQKGVQVKIIFVNKIAPCEDLSLLAKHYPNQLKLFQIPDAIRPTVKEHIAHFCVSDKKRFRIEEIHGDKDFVKDPSIKAIANFNNPEIAKQLQHTFEELVAMSTVSNASSGQCAAA